LRVRGGKLRPVLNALVGFTDALMGTAASFAVARVFIGEIEALIPALRTVEAASSVALKQKIVVGGVFAGLGGVSGATRRVVRTISAGDARSRYGHVGIRRLRPPNVTTL
jgi:hypothetical protein